jgi:hypothetical protein
MVSAGSSPSKTHHYVGSVGDDSPIYGGGKRFLQESYSELFGDLFAIKTCEEPEEKCDFRRVIGGVWITGKNVFHTQRAASILLAEANQDASRMLGGTLDWLPKVISEKPERGAMLGAPEITFGKRCQQPPAKPEA